MLKETLSLLLSKFYSKQENALISNQALPLETSLIVIKENESATAWQEVCRYVAPTDGYINVFGRKQEGSDYFDLQVDLGSGVPKVVTGENFGSERAVILPMRKGATARVFLSFARDIGIVFIRSVGGGYKGIIWRAVLCLNSYSSYYLKHSLNPKNLGSVIRLCRHLLRLPTPILKGRNGCTLPLLVTDTSTLLQDKQPALIFQRRPYLYYLHRMEVNFLSQLSRLRKVEYSAISFTLELQKTKQQLLSFLLTARCNQNVGGALC